MKLKKMIKELQELLDADLRKRKKHREDMKEILQKIKAKEKRLSALALTEFDDDKLKQLRKEINMVHAQRKKGITALKELNEKQDSKD